ncbi:MAG: 3-phosphoshikimate 1-carboxyvinyltransferase [Thermoclostridium sp.]|nr:3-phosphoshikimate 1-carboxyvinyltransferase [Thermoclostridium sp.]
MKNLTIRPSRLSGTIHIPPSKSMAHRAISCAFLSEGESRIDNVELSDDIIATCRAVEALGGDMDILESTIPGRKILVIRGKGTVKIKRKLINCGESGTTARFIIPITRLTADEVVITGEGKLSERPFGVFYEIFDTQKIQYQTQSGMLPLTLNGAIKPGCFSIRGDVSSQFISGLLLALPLLPGDSVIMLTTPLESIGYIEMTIQMQKMFGIRIEFERAENKFLIPGWQKYKPQHYQVEGDWSQAAFWLAAGVFSGPVSIDGLNPDSLQGDKIIEAFLQQMGANLSWKENLLVAQESRLNGIQMDVSQCPDLVPVLAILGSVADGNTEIMNAARLRIKECDRLKAITTELKAMGAKITEYEDSLSIDGKQKLMGGRVYGWNDHRIVMASAIAAATCEKNTTIEGSQAVNKSYPSFWEHYHRLGGKACE